ncbi:3-keto-disaccharide hydrolase [Adhaeribacter swui]
MNVHHSFSKKFILVGMMLGVFGLTQAQAQQTVPTPPKMVPEMTEFWEPEVKVVTPGAGTGIAAPSDAIILFDGKDLSQWVSVKDPSAPAGWTVNKGVFTVKKGTGNIQTKQSFLDYQLHIEWQIPANITGKSQGRGNSGVFLSSIGGGDAGYELQVLDSYNNRTYANGQAGSIYKQFRPLVNSMRKPGEWNVYDVVFTAPRFKEDGTLFSPARVTVFHNGVLIQNNTQIKGPTQYIGIPDYNQPHGKGPIKLQDHGDPSEPISFRNIWIREL